MTTSSDERISSPAFALKALLYLVLCGLVGDITFAFQAVWPRDFGIALSISLMTSLAALLVGSLTGFLFGVPRTTERTEEHPKDAEMSSHPANYRANTNLEQISDWLTKILVGVGLTQLGQVPSALGAIGRAMAHGLGEVPSIATFGAALVVHFVLCGFLFGWLWARLYLRSAFIKADISARELLPEVSYSMDQVEAELPDGSAKEVVKRLRNEVDRQIATVVPQQKSDSDVLRDMASEYERIRQTLSFGRERTVKMSEIVASSRALARKICHGEQEIRDRFKTGKVGDRIVALAFLQAMEYPNLLGIALEAAQEPRSAFEQYQALRAIQGIIPRLSDEQRRLVSETIEKQRAPGGSINERDAPDRWDLSDRILAAVEPHSSPRGAR